MTYDVAIIGAGHNGLVCACYLAAGGAKVLVLERRGVVGGAAVTEEFHPGFRNSTASYTVSLLHPRVIQDLRLAEHGLRIVERPLLNYVVEGEGRGLRIGPTAGDTQRELARRTPRDAERYDSWQAQLGTAVAMLKELLLATPPTDLARAGDLWSALKTGWRYRNLPLEEQRIVHELFTRSAGDVLDGLFADEGLKAAFGFDAVVGNYASPYTPGSAYVLLHHALGEVNGVKGAWGHAIGGMGAITQAMRQACEAAGVEITTDAPVARVLVDNGKTVGVTLEDGSEVFAKR